MKKINTLDKIKAKGRITKSMIIRLADINTKLKKQYRDAQIKGIPINVPRYGEELCLNLFPDDPYKSCSVCADLFYNFHDRNKTGLKTFKKELVIIDNEYYGRPVMCPYEHNYYQRSANCGYPFIGYPNFIFIKIQSIIKLYTKNYKLDKQFKKDLLANLYK